jgi:uncharacterized membrane protein
LDRKLSRASYILAFLGFIDALYLLIIKLSNNKALCIQGIGDCWSVNLSKYSEIAGVPISILGMAAYLAIIVLLFLETKSPFWRNNSPILIFGITLAGTLYSIYLTYIEIYVLKAICPFCVFSALIILGLLGVAIARLAAGSQDENEQ